MSASAPPHTHTLTEHRLEACPDTREQIIHQLLQQPSLTPQEQRTLDELLDGNHVSTQPYVESSSPSPTAPAAPSQNITASETPVSAVWGIFGSVPTVLIPVSYRHHGAGDLAYTTSTGFEAIVYETSEEVAERDMKLAYDLQVEELQNSAARFGTDRHGRPIEAFMHDPVWGEVVFGVGERPAPLTVWCFSCFPCFVSLFEYRETSIFGRGISFPALKPDKARAWRRFLTSCSFLIVAVQVVFLARGCTSKYGIAPLQVNPMVGPWPDELSDQGAKNAAEMLYRSQWWRLLSPLVLHAGVLHLLINAYFQFRIGTALEYEWGSLTYVFVYVVAGSYSSLLSCTCKPNDIGVGASGALMALLGASVVHQICVWRLCPPGEEQTRRGNLSNVVLCIFVTAVFSIVPYMDWAAHLGGCIAGIALGMVLFGHNLASDVHQRITKFCGVFGFVVMYLVTLYDFGSRVHPSKNLLDYCVYLHETYSNYHSC